MPDNMDFTMMFKSVKKQQKMTIEEVIEYVRSALEEKGYNSINQFVGYMLSGDPTYITSHKDARTIITEYERDDLLEVIIKDYLDRNKK